MKIITNTHYQANDGTTFDTQYDCEEYEDYINSEAKLAKLSCLVNTKMSFSIVSSFIYNNYDKIKEIMEGKTEDEITVSTEVDWSEVPAGTVVCVRDFEGEEWVQRKFMYVDNNGRYVCEHSDRGTVHPISWKFAPIPWKKAKLKS